MPGLPPADLLAYAGMGFVGVFGAWKTQLAPLLARWRGARADVPA
jgi:hypothetical protein